MKVAVTGLRGMPNIMGGIESHCEELYPRMLKWDPSLSVECFGRRPYMKSSKAFEYEGVRVTPLPSIRLVSVEAIYSTFLAVLYAGCVSRPDVLHIHGIGPALLTPLARLLGLKVVVTHHGRDYRRAKWGPFAKTLLKVGEQLALRFSNTVIAVSQTLAAEICAEKPGVAGKVVFIPNGVSTLPPPAKGADDPLTTWRLEPGRYILTVGRLVPEKGFQDLIASHGASGAGYKLVIAGAADHESPFARKLLAQASDQVIFTGMLERSKLAELYSNAALFVLPSHHEGLPIAALEAASFATPMLLSDISANLDLGLPAGNYFPVGDLQQLAACLAEPPQAYEIDAPAIRERFDWAVVARQTASVFTAVKAGPDARQGVAGRQAPQQP